MSRFLFLAGLVILASCKTTSEVRREQEMDRLKSEIKDVRGDRADMDAIGEELKVEIARMNNVVEERAVVSQRQYEELKKELVTVHGRLQAMEQKIAAAEAADAAERKRDAEKPKEPKASYDLGRRYYDEGRYGEAAEVLKIASRAKPKSEEGKRSLFLLGESYFADREYASAALEFSEFKKLFPKDPQVPIAIYRQANSFRSMGRAKEAKLFYQELIERFPKSPLVAKAKVELKKLK